MSKHLCEDCKHYGCLLPGIYPFADKDNKVQYADAMSLPYDGLCFRKQRKGKEWKKLVNKKDKGCNGIKLKEEIS